MKPENMLKKLTQIKMKLQKDEAVILDLESLIEELKKEVAISKVTDPTSKKAFKKALSFLKKAGKDREFLSVADKQEIDGKEYLCFTDSFELYCMTEDWALPLFKDAHEAHEPWAREYPKVERIVNIEDVYEVDIPTYEEVVKYIKTHPEEKEDGRLGYRLENNVGGRWCVDMLRLKNVYEILGVSELKGYTNSTNAGILKLKTNSDNFAVLMMIRVYE